MSLKVGLISLGCPKNQVDAEIMLYKLEEAGFEIVDYMDGADAVIVNTCAFIDDAKKEAIENILEVAQLKKDGTVGSVLVTGCLPQRYKDEIMKEIPEVDAVLGIGANADISEYVRKAVSGDKISAYPPRAKLPLTGERILTTPPYWAYLKIADGCSNACSYCTIPAIRGGYRSREMEDILEEARGLALNGAKELVLIAQDTTGYGIDLYGSAQLPELLDRLSRIDGIEWLRLLYCYPDRITDELLDTMAANPKVLHYLDIPLQHIDDKLLKAMNRRGSSFEIKALIQKIRDRIPDIVLRTTFITGFPGEGEEEFENLAEFINEAEFDRLGCFTFSAQEGTEAARLEDTVDEQEKINRIELIMQDQLTITELKNNERIGKTYKVITEGYDAYTDSYYGRTYMDAPEIDGRVNFTSSTEVNEGEFADVEIFGINGHDLLGRAIG